MSEASDHQTEGTELGTVGPTDGSGTPDHGSLPAAAHPGCVRLQVGDLSRSIAFYERVIGLRVHSEERRRAQLGPPDEARVLVELHERPGASRVPRRGPWGLYHFALLLPDRPSLGRFAAHALPTGSVTGVADHAVSEAIYLSDPDGLGVEVYADRPRHTWRRQPSGEYHVVTEPLDIDDLIASGADGPWTDAPVGTVMGHVHLHVGDLRLADGFYHRALGFDRTAWSYPGALFLSAGGYHHHLATNTWAAPRPAADDEARLLTWDLELPNAEAAETAARGLAGHSFDVWREGTGWAARDPWGTEMRMLGTGLTTA